MEARLLQQMRKAQKISAADVNFEESDEDYNFEDDELL